MTRLLKHHRLDDTGRSKHWTKIREWGTKNWESVMGCVFVTRIFKMVTNQGVRCKQSLENCFRVSRSKLTVSESDLKVLSEFH